MDDLERTAGFNDIASKYTDIGEKFTLVTLWCMASVVASLPVHLAVGFGWPTQIADWSLATCITLAGFGIYRLAQGIVFAVRTKRTMNQELLKEM